MLQRLTSFSGKNGRIGGFGKTGNFGNAGKMGGAGSVVILYLAKITTRVPPIDLLMYR